MDFKSKLSDKTDEVNKIVNSCLPKEGGLQSTIIEAMNYSVNVGGKRLRPILMKASYELFSYDNKEEEAIKLFMAAIECIHTYSLVHDDLPAMDNDEYRRGNLTTHKKYGHAMGILSGDGLLNYAYELCAKGIMIAKDKEKAGEALCVLSKKAGIYGMVGGQTVDIELTGKKMDDKAIRFIYDLKTSALIEAALMCGAILAGADNRSVEVMEQIGNSIGLAFQIQDDILDVTSTTKELGKPVFSDEKNNKTTYVSLYGMDAAVKKVSELSYNAVEKIKEISRNNEFLVELVEYLITRRK